MHSSPFWFLILEESVRVWDLRSVVGGQWSVVGSRKSEVGSRKSEVGSGFWLHKERSRVIDHLAQHGTQLAVAAGQILVDLTANVVAGSCIV